MPLMIHEPYIQGVKLVHLGGGGGAVCLLNFKAFTLFICNFEVDPVLAKTGSGALYPKRREIFKILLMNNSDKF